MTRAWVPDATALADWMLCSEYFRSRHRLGLVKERAEESAADAGAAWHEALRTWFSNVASVADGAAESVPLSLADSTLAALIAAWGEEPLFVGAPPKRPRGLYEALLRVYMQKWPREADAFEVVRNEEWREGTLSTKPGTPFRYGGRVDRLIRLDGHIYVMDAKTTSSNLSEAYFAQYALSPQMVGYVALELVNGQACEGVYIDAVHVDTRSQKAKPEHCQRYGPIRYRDDQLSEWARNTEWKLRQIEALEAERGLEQRWPQNPASCFKWQRACMFWERCAINEALAKTLPGYVEERWEPNAQV